MDYGVTGEYEMDMLSPMVKNTFEAMIKPAIDRAQKNYENSQTYGKEHGRPKTVDDDRIKELYKKGLRAEAIAKELKDYGINLNFAPCADVNTNPDNPIIGERAFSDKADEVIKGVGVVSDIYRKNGIIPCIKHYPGHGDADSDSHLTLPRIDLPLDEMEKIHIAPFKAGVEGGIEMIMAAHLHCTCFDKEVIPSSLSRNAIGYLRNSLGYDGVIISDDMVMKGVQAYGSAEAVVVGIEAGLDMFIFRDADEQTIEAIEKVVEIVNANESLKARVMQSNERISNLKRRYGI